MVTLYRGLAVPEVEAKRIEQKILSEGVSGTEGNWQFHVPDILHVRASLEALFRMPDLTRDHLPEDTTFRGFCACGGATGAAYYALRHNFTKKNDYPLVIEFTASIDDIYVDGRDFLYPAFQLWDRHFTNNQDWQSAVLCDLFGPSISRYFDTACQSAHQPYRIAMCDLATFDSEVAWGHVHNERVIAGRYGTMFTSAFFVKAPVTANRITRVYVPEDCGDGMADISLPDFLNGVGA